MSDPQSNKHFDEQAKKLLAELKLANDDFEKASHELALDIDKKLAATDLALEEASKEIERGEEE